MTDPAFLALLIDALAKTIPDDPDQSAAGRAAGLAMARTLLEAGNPPMRWRPRWRPARLPGISRRWTVSPARRNPA